LASFVITTFRDFHGVTAANRKRTLIAVAVLVALARQQLMNELARPLQPPVDVVLPALGNTEAPYNLQ
jgi:hypothetical protein